MSEAPAVLFERRADHVALVTLNRPEARNAINGAVAQAMDEIVARSESDDDIWAVVLTGSGSLAFSAGADLKAVSAGRGSDLSTPRGGFGGFVYAPRSKPWIAAVNGPALAGGCELALACDLIIAVPEARFGLPEVKRALAATAGGLFRLPRVLPQRIALEMIATGDPISAERALALGMINQLVPAAQLINAALALAGRITVNAPVAVRASLQVARQAFSASDAELRSASEEAWLRVRESEDFKEGPLAFIEKRAPNWSGR